jgi:hypothetical protein
LTSETRQRLLAVRRNEEDVDFKLVFIARHAGGYHGRPDSVCIYDPPVLPWKLSMDTLGPFLTGMETHLLGSF